MEKVRTERAAFLDRAARLQAEFDNFRKRNAKEQAGISRVCAGRGAEIVAADSRQPGSRVEDQGRLAGRFSLAASS